MVITLKPVVSGRTAWVVTGASLVPLTRKHVMVLYSFSVVIGATLNVLPKAGVFPATWIVLTVSE